ncbi:4-hydroxy-3-methylbut-2-enyl diphosphate reductase [Flexibacter flexilis]|nr:4-hydroxy-3-methylbut-2-enyl diphosphate reductase [Flexibacter flexilis]
MTSTEEFVILVNAADEPQGLMEKMQAHHEGKLHRAISVLIFDRNNRMLIHRRAATKYHSAGLWTNACCSHPREAETNEAAAHRRLQEEMGFDCALYELFTFTYRADVGHGLIEHELDHVFVGIYEGEIHPNPAEADAYEYVSLEKLEARMQAEPHTFTEWFKIIVPQLTDYLLKIPYLGQKNISRAFKHSKAQEYEMNFANSPLYQSQICTALKQTLRRQEGSAGSAGLLDFGAVKYLVASHFGFCLGVSNAIDIAYSALTENPDKRIFMLSELIHNPFVNEDLARRGLSYLQNEKGVATKAPDGTLLWDKIEENDVVIVPAFGATNEDKTKLIRKGLNITYYDATCRLVENVWNRASDYARKGFTVIIHGKFEHEETRASFSQAAQYGHVLVVRDLFEAQIVANVIAGAPDAIDDFNQYLFGRHSEGFEPLKHLEKIALVNQTTLLASETLEISALFKKTLTEKYGAEQINQHLGRTQDTLCYATNVNQNAAAKLFDNQGDYAFVIGGKNSSNTSQLYKMAQQQFGDKAYYIESEIDILSAHEIRHYDYGQKKTVIASFLPETPIAAAPPKILITAGASCPDGIIQQVIVRINSFFAPSALRDVSEVLQDLTQQEIS